MCKRRAEKGHELCPLSLHQYFDGDEELISCLTAADERGKGAADVRQ